MKKSKHGKRRKEKLAPTDPTETPVVSDGDGEIGERLLAPSHEDIEIVAYLKYLDAGRKDGEALQH